MNSNEENDFLSRTEAVFEAIEDFVDEAELDADCHRSGNVLTIEGCTGDVVVNRHTPTRELWVASRAGGSHFSFDGSLWRTASGMSLNDVLSQALSDVCGESVVVHIDE